MSFSPPSLFGTIIQFQSRDQLDWFEREEMSESRLTVIGDGVTKLFTEMVVDVRLASQDLGSMTVMAVHSDVDLLGLQIIEWKRSSAAIPTSEKAAVSKCEPKAPTFRAGEVSPQAKSSSASPTAIEVEGASSNRAMIPKTGADAKNAPSEHHVSTSESGNRPDEQYGGLLLDGHSDSAHEGFAVTASVPATDSLTTMSKTVSSETSRPSDASKITSVGESGQFRKADVFFPLEQSTLIGFLVHVQSRCISGELILKTPNLLATLYTDSQGQICVPDESLALLEGLGEQRSLGSYVRQSLQIRVRDALVNALAVLSRVDDVQFRFVSKVESTAASNIVPFTVYCCPVLHQLLKGVRLDSFKRYYEARSGYFVNGNDKAPICVADYRLDRKPARFFDLVANEEHDLRTLLKVSPVSNGETYRLLRMGELLELISFSSTKLTEIDLSEEHLALLKQQFARSQEGHFEAMGAHMVSHPKMYVSILDGLKAKYGAESAYALHSFRHRELCAQIVRLGQEAFEYLSQRRLRVAYRKQRFEKTVLRQAADVLLEKADMSRLRGDQLLMRESLEMALELDPILTRTHVQNQKAEAATKPEDVS
jgi:hypothetical protein